MPASLRFDPASPASDSPHEAAFDLAFEDGRQVVTLRPHGAGRFASAAFLAVWLCGWALGELFAGSALVATLLATVAPGVLEAIGASHLFGDRMGGGAAFILMFLSVWLTFWTIGGIAAMRELLRMVAARDRIAIEPGALEVDQQLGPFRNRLRFEAAELRRIALGRGDALVAHTASGPVILSGLGTPEQRRALAPFLEQALAVKRDDSWRQEQREQLPNGWESEPTADGAGVLLRRATRITRRQAVVVYGFAAVFAIGFVVAAVPPLRGEVSRAHLFGALPPLVMAALLTIGAGYLHAGGRVIAVFAGRLEVRRFVFDRWRVQPQTVSFLSLEVTRDSDGDRQHRLIAHGAKSVTLGSAMNEAGDLLHLGRWLAARLGVRFDAPKDLADA